MDFINLELLQVNRANLKSDWDAKKPFRYLVVENFLYPDKASLLLQSYPTVEQGNWDGTTYINQKNKFQQREFSPGSVFNEIFDELNSLELLNEIEHITSIEDLIPDKTLFGGGLHQSITGAFLDVHVDYNIHPETKFHRRLNILIYLNKDWQDEYAGHLQLWDMDKKVMIEKISPLFNRMVMFETNEISFHGHPDPLKTPVGVTRKSIATYYYTKTRPTSELTGEHNTIYLNTQGLKGKAKNVLSGVKALFERIGW